MKKYLILLVSLFIFVACTSNVNEETFICCSQTIIQSEHIDTTLTRGSKSIFLVTDKEWLEIPIAKRDTITYIELCFKSIPNDIIVTSGNSSIKVGKKRKCYLTTHPEGYVRLYQSSQRTPKGNITYAPKDDSVFMSGSIVFTKRNDNVYLTVDRGRTQNVNNHPTISLNRQLFILKANIIISDLSSGIFFHKLSLKDFEEDFGKISNWKVQSFITDFPLEYNFLNQTSKDSGIVVLSNKSNLDGNISHDAIQLQWGQPVIIGRFTGIGKITSESPYLFPVDINSKKLCFSFYNRKNNNTLEIPLNSLTITPNIIQEIFVVIDIDDFEFGMNSRSTIPYKVYYFKTKLR